MSSFADDTADDMEAGQQCPPPTPGSSLGLRLVVISDTHMKHLALSNRGIPEGDVLIHGGDFSDTGKKSDLESFVQWFDSQQHPQKIFIAGNHEITLESSYYVNKGKARFHQRLKEDPVQYSQECQAIVRNAISTYLEDSSVDLKIPSDTHGPIVCYGSPWTPEFCDWGFNYDRGSEKMKSIWGSIPANTDVLITHGPPYGHGDRTNPTNFRCGCEDLLKNIQSREKPPRIHIFGHIHEDRGTWFDGKTLFVNASSCTFFYRATNKPIVLFLPLDPSQPATVIDS